MLYGEGGIGGAINVIPKTPEKERSGQVRVTAGEDDTTFVGIDLTGGLTDTLAYRLNYGSSRSDNGVKNGDSEADMLSLALRWEASENLIFSTRYDYADQEPMQYFGIPVVDGDFASGLEGANFNVGDADVSYQDQAVRFKVDWTISESISMVSEAYHLETKRFWKNAEYYSLASSSGLVDRFDPLVIGHDMEHNGLRINFVFDKQRNISNLRSSFGFEINKIDFKRPSNFGPGNTNPIDWENDVDTVDRNNFDPGTLSDLTDADVQLDNFSDVDQYAIFTESQLQVSEKLAIVVGLRYEDVETDYVRLGQDPIYQTVDAITGRVGLIYDLNNSTALYSQYATGATHPSDSLVTASAANRKSDFIESEQLEVGIKQQLVDGQFEWTMALFDIVKNDLVEDDPDSGDPGDKVVIPEQTAKGVELGFKVYLNPYLQFYGNGSLLEADTDSGVAPNYIPEKTANLGVKWRAHEKVQWIADVRYVGERFHPSIPIPSYTVLDTSIRLYLTDKASLTARVDNLTDEKYASASYYSSTWLIGKPRTISVSADYSF